MIHFCTHTNMPVLGNASASVWSSFNISLYYYYFNETNLNTNFNCSTNMFVFSRQLYFSKRMYLDMFLWLYLNYILDVNSSFCVHFLTIFSPVFSSFSIYKHSAKREVNTEGARHVRHLWTFSAHYRIRPFKARRISSQCTQYSLKIRGHHNMCLYSCQALQSLVFKKSRWVSQQCLKKNWDKMK